MTMTFADQVVMVTHLYDNPQLTKLRCAVRLRNCKAESISFGKDKGKFCLSFPTWYGVLKSRGRVIAVLIAPIMDDITKTHIINIGAFDRTGKRHLTKWHEIKSIGYGLNIPIINIEGMDNI